MRRLSLFWLLLLLLVLAVGCAGDDDDDDNDDGGDLTLYEGFDSLELVEQHGGELKDSDDLSVFVPGLLGSSFWLGDGNYVMFQGHQVINKDHGTIEFWMLNKDNWQDGEERQILHLNGPSNFAIFKEKQTDYIAVSIGGRTVVRAEHGNFVGWNSWPQWASRWTHIAVTWNHLVAEGDEDDVIWQGEIVLYVDGEAKNQFVGNVPAIDVDNALMLGPWTEGYDANILIDELRIYSRAKSWDEFTAYDRNMPDRDLPYPLLVWPTPKPYGLRPEDGFAIDHDTKIIVGDEDYDRLSDALVILRNTIRDNLGFTPQIGPASQFSGDSNFIAIGEPTKNGLVASVAEKRKFSVRPGNPGPGAYFLEVYPEGIVAAGSDYAGTVHGLMTLIQLMRQHDAGYIPAITLVDAPDFEIRAAEWPADQLTLNEEAKRRIRYFASLKLTHLLLRTTDYLYLGDTDVRERVVEFFDFVRRYGLTPVPAVDLLSNSAYINEACDEQGVDCRAAGREDTYCPCEPFVYEGVVEPMLAQIIYRLHPSVIHIGHDDVVSLTDDARCVATQLSPAEVFAYDVNQIVDAIHGMDSTVQIWMWADMLNPLHNGGRLSQPAPYEDAPAPPPVISLIPHTLVFNLWYYAPVDVFTYILALLSLSGFEEGNLPYYTAGPVGDDISGALMWMRNAYDMNAAGYVYRPLTAPNGPGDLTDEGWVGLTAANEFAWTLFVPQDVHDVWYDYTVTSTEYGGF